jgi:hypothetical protein
VGDEQSFSFLLKKKIDNENSIEVGVESRNTLICRTMEIAEV